MSSPDDRLDAAIDDVARAMTSAPHGDIAGDFAARIALRRRLSRRILVPALAAAAILLALLTMTELRAPSPLPAPNSVTVVAIPQSPNGPRSSVPGPQSSVERSPVTSHPPSATGGSPTVRRVVRHAPRRLAADPPFESDLAPAPLQVAGVVVPPISVATEPAPPPIDVQSIEVAPIEPRGGSR